jgi:hypothetical protein
MMINIVTKEDLEQFKSELVGELKTLLSTRPAMPVKWLRSYQVREMLSISPGTLQNLRIYGHVEFTKIGGSIFYNYEDIVKMMEKDKVKMKGSVKSKTS